MKFCQTDGTPLVEIADVAPADPYKTVVGSQNEIASAIPVDPFKTMVASDLRRKIKRQMMFWNFPKNLIC